MAKLAPLEVNIHIEDQSFYYTFPVSVSSKGIFIVEVSEEGKWSELGLFATLLIKKRNAGYDPKVISSQKDDKTLLLQAKNLDDIRECLNETIKDLAMQERSITLLIGYEISFSGMFFKAEKGGIYPNAAGLQPEGKWVGDRGNGFSRECGFKIKAACVEKRDYKYAKGGVTRYAEPDDKTLGEYGIKLNAWRYAHSIKSSLGCSNSTILTVPYTEENAKFFIDLIVGVCTLYDKINEYLGDSGKLADLISHYTSGALLSLAEKSEEEISNMEAEHEKTERN